MTAASSASAQTALERFERQLEQIQRETRFRADPDVPPGQRALVDYGAYVSTLFFAIDDPRQETHILRQYDLVGWGHINLDGAHEVFVRGRTSYRDWNSGDAFDQHGDDWVGPTLDRGWYRFDLARHLAAYDDRTINGNLVVTVGRQLVVWGSGLVLSEDLDGALATLSAGNLSLDLLAGQTRDSTNDFDTSRPGFDHDTHRNFFGALLAYQVGKHRPYAYGLVQRDQNDDGTVSLAGVPTEFGYDSHYLGLGVTGALTDRLLYTVEGVYEGGEGLSSSFVDGAIVDQSAEDIRAWAFDARLDYVFADVRRTRLSGEVIVASGDDDRRSTTNTFGGNRPGTDDTAFNGFGLLNTGMAFGAPVSNLIVGRLGASTFPLPDSGALRRWQVGTDFFVFAKTQSDAPIDEPTDDERYLGSEIDLYTTWQVTSDFTLFLRYGIFFPGAAIETDHDPRNFLVVGATYAF